MVGLSFEISTHFEGRILDIDIDIMLKWGEVNAQLQKIGKPMPIMDSLIASSCLAKRFCFNYS